MDDDSSNDVEAVEIIESPRENNDEKRPIMALLKRLIRNKQNTVMTNSQIIEIMKQEFDIDVKTCHELQVDVYIKIIKTYLKTWPQWEDLENMSTKLSTATDFDAVIEVLDHKYKNLKEYLGVMLDAAKPLAKKAMEELESDPNKVEEDIHSSDVVMEVMCTRDQLNHLFFQRPRSDLQNSIFNISKIEPTRICLNTLSFESILNFWWTKIYIQLQGFIYYRELVYRYKHTLVNKARDERMTTEILDTRFFNRDKKSREHPKATVLQYFDKILDLCNNQHVHQVLQVIFNLLKNDLKQAPDNLNVPSNYRKNANQYQYVRYLFVENADNKDPKYDLQLEELMTPTYQFFIGRLGKLCENGLPPIQEWLKIECMMCKVKFQGSTELMSVLQAHFNDCHQHEPDWQCPHCKRLFSMEFLSKHRWYHDC